MKYARVGVVGAGVMGVGVAQNLAQTGHRVMLVDVSEEILDRARAEIAKGLRLAAMFEPAARAADHSAILEQISITTDYERLGDVDFVVENTTESWAVKQSVYPQLDRICRDDCILAANTSAISIARLASSTRRPDRVIGMHFMNPVPRKPLVEVIRGGPTSEATVEAAKTFLQQMGKRAIVVKDMPGFVSNRVLMLTINEAIFVVQDDVASPADVDEIFIQCFAHKMGPLATADLIGLDTVLHSLQVLADSYGDSKYRPCPRLVQMVQAGLLGRKSGRGFFDYTGRRLT
ncbi:3-hydroxyacyl-CoA dehydrogenase family protein [Corallococcus caeni]|uniref:3-hydroxyacyl-CoA dehydrogenase family protein n=1 Tax=Corallococcus caeni TaxID=3082388 RepID=UPI0029581C62|nr:3-hydroxyacyl-CoA dehydrogenase family protein [Corallococcus sp. KH5-1]